eukprot:CCRYP_019789-RA/>CCRYP_019789-RA protein AED:0.11 eAED:0.28 QI:0/0/0/1/0/0/4/0/520
MQLGFSNSLLQEVEKEAQLLGHQSPQWSDWDGGKIGGRPSWLNPRDLPEGILRCRGPCGKSTDDKLGSPLCFVTQLYCPADDVTVCFCVSEMLFCVVYANGVVEKSSANQGEMNSTPEHNLSDCIQVLRCQLPKKNDFYPLKGDVDGEWIKHTSAFWAKTNQNDQLNLCAVCGLRSRGKCPKQKKFFCSSDHQKEYLRATKKSRGDKSTNGANSVSLKYLPSLCFASELVVEEEPQPSHHATKNDFAKKASDGLFKSVEISDVDADLEQSDLNVLTGNSAFAEAATGVTDPTTLAFYARMAIGGEVNDVRDQCLRYSRWPETKQGSASIDDDDDGISEGPLWLTSDNQPPLQYENETSSPPSHRLYCGAPRSFEFQILPQMLHYLCVDPSEKRESDGGMSSQVLTESEIAILLEAKSKIESGVDLPPGFREQHERAVAKLGRRCWVLAKARLTVFPMAPEFHWNGALSQFIHALLVHGEGEIKVFGFLPRGGSLDSAFLGLKRSGISQRITNLSYQLDVL